MILAEQGSHRFSEAAEGSLGNNICSIHDVNGTGRAMLVYMDSRLPRLRLPCVLWFCPSLCTCCSVVPSLCNQSRLPMYWVVPSLYTYLVMPSLSLSRASPVGFIMPSVCTCSCLPSPLTWSCIPCVLGRAFSLHPVDRAFPVPRLHLSCVPGRTFSLHPS